MCPPGLCSVDVTANAVDGPMWKEGLPSVGLYVDVDIEVKGPTPNCDGSFVWFRIDSLGHGEHYQYDFAYWQSLLNITFVEDALRKANHTLLLLCPG